MKIATKRLCLPATSAVLLALYGMALCGQEGASRYLKKSADWFAGEEANRITINILSWQSQLGGWPKNTDTTSQPYTGKSADLKPTFDNGATTDELRFLARRYQTDKNDTYKDAFVKGYDYVLKAQYPTGGWPQFYPPSRQYHRHITFNDDAMVRLMEFLRETYSSDLYAPLLDAKRTKAARDAFERGIQCILKCQIKVNGKLTAWCAQHDEKDYSPRGGRKYELPSISGSESVKIVELLMSLDKPSPEVIQAIDSAAAWFEASKLKGVKIVTVPDANSPKGTDARMMEDPSARPLWARFYEIETNKPIYCDRDGVAKYKLSDIGYERRNGYAWTGSWALRLLDRDYPAWKAKQAKK